MSVTLLDLREQYKQLQIQQPKLRIRDAAAALGVSEAELVALGIGRHAIRLKPDWAAMFSDLQTLGTVMALTRNDDAVHERHGVYTNISFQGPVGLAVNPDIDLRMFMMHWQYAFAVEENGRKSIQVFDKSGVAVHKIYCTEATNFAAYDQLVKKFTAPDQHEEITVTPYPSEPADIEDSKIDLPSFQSGWQQLKDTHDFFALLKSHGVSRLQAMRIAPEGMAIAVGNDTSRKMLQAVAEKKIPIMVFVGNRGCIQIHTGTIEKLMEAGSWYNVLDELFSLHLRESAIAHTYIVTKPSTDGDIHSIEAYDKNGGLIIQFFGKRKPGIPELAEWKNLLDELINN